MREGDKILTIFMAFISPDFLCLVCFTMITLRWNHLIIFLSMNNKNLSRNKCCYRRIIKIGRGTNIVKYIQIIHNKYIIVSVPVLVYTERRQGNQIFRLFYLYINPASALTSRQANQFD